MAAKHGTRRRYVDGCRCEDCAEAERVYRRAYRQRKAMEGANPGVSAPVVTLRTADTQSEAGPVEAGVELELEGLAQAEARPGLKEMALELARVMDNPKATNQKAATSKALAEVLATLHKGADVRKSRLASVREMTSVKTG